MTLKDKARDLAEIWGDELDAGPMWKKNVADAVIDLAREHAGRVADKLLPDANWELLASRATETARRARQSRSLLFPESIDRTSQAWRER